VRVSADKLGVVPVESWGIFHDDRGFFMQSPTYNGVRFAHAFNNEALTLRGLHFNSRPTNGKVVACVAGCAFDVLVDVREGSPTYLDWAELILHPGDAIAFDHGLAHGYLTITPGTVLAYVLDGNAGIGADDKGLRWDDPRLGIDWPDTPKVISAKDRAWGLLP
jgi:dTDP-4-dehydrorhamnose 3,5-epimerase